MNLRCIYCQTPFTLSRTEMLTAIMTMNEKNMNHYDGHCPRCRRANSISRQRMELFFPNWQDAAKKQASADAKAAAAAANAEVPATAFLKTEPLPKTTKIGTEKKSAAKKPAAAKSSTAKAKAPAAKKPAASKTKKK